MNIIVAVDENWGIGYEGNLLYKIPNDLKRFKQLTENKTVVMGRKTLESLPNGKPLSNRNNIVISGNKNYKIDGCIIINSLDELPVREDIFIIGGSEIYKQIINYCNTIYLTKIYHKFVSDVYFPNLNEMREWKITQKSEVYEYNHIKYQYFIYKNFKN